MKTRFSGIIGEEYELIKLAIPNYIKMQTKIATTIKNYFAENQSPKIVELGCGTGITTKIIVKYNPKANIICIDNEKVMLKQAENYLKKQIKDGSLKLVCADGLKYLRSLPSKRFDAFISAVTIHNFNHKYRIKVFREIYRILKTDGIFVNGDKYGHNKETEHRKKLVIIWKKYVEVFAIKGKFELLKEWMEHDIEDNRSENIMRENQFKKDMKEVGFKNIKKIYRKGGYAIYRTIKPT